MSSLAFSRYDRFLISSSLWLYECSFQIKPENIGVILPCLYICPQEWQITRLSHEYDSEPFGKELDAAIQKLASESRVEVIVRTSHTLYNPDK